MQPTLDKPVVALTNGLRIEDPLGGRELDPGVAANTLNPRLSWSRLKKEDVSKKAYWGPRRK